MIDLYQVQSMNFNIVLHTIRIILQNFTNLMDQSFFISIIKLLNYLSVIHGLDICHRSFYHDQYICYINTLAMVKIDCIYF